MKGKAAEKPIAHIGQASLVIGSLALLLAAGLALVGLLDRLDEAVAAWFRTVIGGPFPKQAAAWLLWPFTAAAAYGVSFSMLSASGCWRRWVLWISSVALTALWAPVLALASHEPRVAAPVVAAVWSGICVFVYVGKHRMPGED